MSSDARCAQQDVAESIAQRVRTLRARMAAAAVEAGRSPDGITLVGVCKRQPLERVLAAHDAGVHDFGESTAQGLQAKAEAMRAAGKPVRWHFIGRLQRNKVGTVLRYADVLHTLDRPELLDAVVHRLAQQEADDAGDARGERSKRLTPLDVFVQINIGREPQKGGIDPSQAVAFAREVARHPMLRLRGLMAIPPAHEDAEPYFRELAHCLERVRRTPEGQHVSGLSMGMSHDFATAIRCGATCIRVGEGLFGPRMS